METRQLKFRDRHRDRLCSLVLPAIALVLTAFGVAAAALSEIDHQRNLVLWLTFDDINGDRVPDHSGQDNHGAIKGRIKQVEGRRGRAIHTGYDGYIELPDNESLNITGRTITMMLWVYPKDELGFSDLLTKGDDPQKGCAIQLKNDGRVINFYAGGWSRGEATATLERNTFNRSWHHIAAVRDGRSLKLYVDGQLKAEQKLSGEIGRSSDAWNVGRNSWHPHDRAVNGMIDEVRIYTQALTAEEIKEVMNQSAQGD